MGRLRVLARLDCRTCLYLRDVAGEAYAPLVDVVVSGYEEDLYVEVDEMTGPVRGADRAGIRWSAA